MNFDTILFRCSSLGKIMTDPKERAAKERGDLSETTKTYLRQLYREIRYNRRKIVTTKYMEKGTQVEEDGITLYSRVKKRFFKKNEQHLTNEYIQGTPDLFTGLEIMEAEEIIDTKCSWDLFTFPFPDDKLESDYKWQAQGYMALTGASMATIAYCLVDTPLTLINDEKRKLLYKMDVVTDQSPEYLKASEELERNMTFGDIPMHERVVEFRVIRNEEDIRRLYARIEKCREYLNGLAASQIQEPIKMTA